MEHTKKEYFHFIKSQKEIIIPTLTLTLLQQLFIESQDNHYTSTTRKMLSFV